MKITDMGIYNVISPIKEFYTMHSKKPFKGFQEYLIKIKTDENIFGIGSCWLHKFNPEYEKYLKSEIRSFLLNKTIDLDFIEEFTNQFCYKKYDINQLVPPGCVEMALFDIIGKKENMPVYKLLDGKKNKIKAYASVLEPHPLLSPEKWSNQINKIYKSGFKAIKIHIGTKSNNPKYIIDVVKSIRKKLDFNIDLMIDVMQAWSNNPFSFSQAFDLATKLEKYEIKWLEEPIPYFNNIELSSKLCESVNIDIAGGGAMYGQQTFDNILKNNALDIVQPDVQYAGGIFETIKINKLANKYKKKCIPHFFGTGIALSTTLHACSIINSEYIEFPYHPPYITPKTRDAILKNPIEIDDNGDVSIPRNPGIGVELNNSWKKYLC